MSVETVCEICERNQGQYTCSQCGRVVCERHYDTSEGLCEECAGPRTF